jgi:hypothetical protein
MNGPWVNIDNTFGITTLRSATMAFGERANNNSIMTAKLYTLYSDKRRTVNAGEVVDCRAVVYYSNVDASATARLATQNKFFDTTGGWHAVVAYDPDGTAYELRFNFLDDSPVIASPVKPNRAVTK